jgi:hypothetical protein
VFAPGHTRTPEGVIQFVYENVESLRLNRRHGGHGCTGRYVPARVVQPGREIFGNRTIEVYDHVLAHIPTLRECRASCRVDDTRVALAFVQSMRERAVRMVAEITPQHELALVAQTTTLSARPPLPRC